MCLLDKNNVATDAATDNAMDATTDEFLTSRRYCSAIRQSIIPIAIALFHKTDLWHISCDSAGIGDTCRKVCIYDIQNSVYNGSIGWILWINNNNDRFKSKG